MTLSWIELTDSYNNNSIVFCHVIQLQAIAVGTEDVSAKQDKSVYASVLE